MRGINRVKVLARGQRQFPGVQKERPGLLRMPGGVEDAPSLQQVPDLRSLKIVAQQRQGAVKRLVRVVELALQALGAGDLRQQFDEIRAITSLLCLWEQRAEFCPGFVG